MRTRMFPAALGTTLLLVLAVASPAQALNFAVDSTLDVDDGGAPSNGCEASGGDECTMREAIFAANASAGPDSITFSGALAQGAVINIASALPQITQETDIAPGNFGFIRVELNGPGPGAGTVAGLSFAETADNSEVNVLSIVDFDRGVALDGADNVSIVSSRIGLTATGTAAGNGNTLSEGGIHMSADADDNTIGPLITIVANAGDGIDLGSSTGSGTTIIGSRIGTDNGDSTTLGNGGHGIDAGPTSDTSIQGGVIGNNGFSGILTSGTGTTITSATIGIGGSTDLGNGLHGISVIGAGTATIGGTGPTDGNTISGNGSNGINLESVAGSVLQSNKVGTDSTGNVDPALRNGNTGVFVSNSPSNRIGTPGEGNLITNNANLGVEIADPGSTGNRVEANVIGLGNNPPDGNVLEGIRVGLGADDTVIGSPGAGNVVARNGANGILVEGDTTAGTSVQGNLVGVGADGTTPQGNGVDGIAVSQAPATVVGGLGAGEGNTVSGNGGDGIDLRNGTDDAVVRGNRIGTNSAGTLGVPNLRGLRLEGDRAVIEGNAIAGNVTEGIQLDQGVDFRIQGNRIGQGVSEQTIGNGEEGVEVRDGTGVIGGAGAAANTITGNLGAGIGFDDVDARATLAENAIFANGGLGIDLDLDVAGGTPNDPGDADAGANTLQNAPVLSSATSSGGQTTVTGTIGTTPNTGITLRFFASAACDPSGAGEGQRFLGVLAIGTDGAGAAGFTATLPPVASGEQVTATATGPGGTSEFSACQALAPSALAIAPAAARVAEGGRAAFTVTRSGPADQDAFVSVASADGSARAGDDYDPVETAVFFAAGETTKNVSMAIRDDAAAEGDETLSVALSAPVRAGLGNPATATVTIPGNDREPDSNITGLRRRIAASSLRRISGSASDADGDLARVEVAIYQARSGARAAALRPSCRNINARGRAVRGRVDARRRCRPTIFLRASGASRWSLRLRRTLPKGTWVVISRAVDRAGRRETTFTARDRNRVVVRIT